MKDREKEATLLTRVGSLEVSGGWWGGREGIGWRLARGCVLNFRRRKPRTVAREWDLKCFEASGAQIVLCHKTQFILLMISICGYFLISLISFFFKLLIKVLIPCSPTSTQCRDSLEGFSPKSSVLKFRSE